MHSAQTRSSRSKRALLTNIALLVVAAFGIGLLVYPQAADWFASRNQQSEISGYAEGVDRTSPEERDQKLAAARAYNRTLNPGSLIDPYIGADPDEIARTPVFQAYVNLLRVTGTDAIGAVNYPRLGINMPVYHGTADETISKGVGHLFGTSMPVGGPSTHAVLTAHSGMAKAKLFTPLLKAEVGDTLSVQVLGEALHYRVEAIETVPANKFVDLQVVEGEDLLTLFTCTPTGVNTHRFMVYTKRIPASQAEGDGALAGNHGPGFPWWLLWAVLGLAVIALILFRPSRRRREETATVEN